MKKLTLLKSVTVFACLGLAFACSDDECLEKAERIYKAGIVVDPIPVDEVPCDFDYLNQPSKIDEEGRAYKYRKL